ncbi:Photosystem I reaction center subunit XI [Hibiscus syriacus]|uniref:PSI subunit V n=1 Tax=Hibiscus syriacus TaxID=106335 RepID=A0A6A3B8E8_HIBSY|nr:Photosystem I reaction center subunit XI [Hibiscus syriacus]
MATTCSPMATQLKSSFTSSVARAVLVIPKGISGAPFRVSPGNTRTPCFTVKAVQSDKPTFQVIQPINGDPFIGSLETPITSSPLIAWYLSNLPAYRTAVNPLLRGIEVGLPTASSWSGRDPQHLLDNVWRCIVQRRRALDSPELNPDWEEEGARPAANG